MNSKDRLRLMPPTLRQKRSSLKAVAKAKHIAATARAKVAVAKVTRTLSGSKAQPLHAVVRMGAKEAGGVVVAPKAGTTVGDMRDL